jgi:hypothetical protein
MLDVFDHLFVGVVELHFLDVAGVEVAVILSFFDILDGFEDFFSSIMVLLDVLIEYLGFILRLFQVIIYDIPGTFGDLQNLIAVSIVDIVVIFGFKLSVKDIF